MIPTHILETLTVALTALSSAFLGPIIHDNYCRGKQNHKEYQEWKTKTRESDKESKESYKESKQSNKEPKESNKESKESSKESQESNSNKKSKEREQRKNELDRLSAVDLAIIDLKLDYYYSWSSWWWTMPSDQSFESKIRKAVAEKGQVRYKYIYGPNSKRSYGTRKTGEAGKAVDV